MIALKLEEMPKHTLYIFIYYLYMYLSIIVTTHLMPIRKRKGKEQLIITADQHEHPHEQQNNITDMELEDSSGAHRVTLVMQLHFFCLLSVLRLQRTATQEINTMW